MERLIGIGIIGVLLYIGYLIGSVLTLTWVFGLIIVFFMFAIITHNDILRFIVIVVEVIVFIGILIGFLTQNNSIVLDNKTEVILANEYKIQNKEFFNFDFLFERPFRHFIKPENKDK